MPRTKPLNKSPISRSKQSRNLPVVHNSMPPVTQSTDTSRPSFTQTIKEGFAFGVGSSIAHSIFRPAAAPVIAPPLPTESTKPEKALPKEYVQCMKDFDNKEACAYLLE